MYIIVNKYERSRAVGDQSFCWYPIKLFQLPTLWLWLICTVICNFVIFMELKKYRNKSSSRLSENFFWRENEEISDVNV